MCFYHRYFAGGVCVGCRLQHFKINKEEEFSIIPDFDLSNPGDESSTDHDSQEDQDSVDKSEGESESDESDDEDESRIAPVDFL